MDITPASQASKSKKPKLTAKKKRILLILVAILLGVGLLAGTYKLGYNNGFSKGEEKGKKSAAKSNLGDFFNSSANPFRSVTGEVKSVTNDTLEVNSSRGEVETVKINDKTKITKKTTTLKVSDIKPDQKVTVFVQGQDGDLTATRIVVRD
jgi:Cu/Ag efflux protein CusF